MSDIPLIRLDSRVGSRELYPVIPSPVELTHLEYGDACFLTAEGVSVGFERKTIRDFLGSMATGRLSGHQIIGLQHSYSRSVILVEGKWEIDSSGILTCYNRVLTLGKNSQRRFLYREMMGYLLTLGELCGIGHEFTENLRHTAEVIHAYRKWWGKPTGDHRSHLGKNTPDRNIVYLRKPSLVQRVAMELSGVDIKRARALAKRFSTVLELTGATEKELLEVDGVGKIIAGRIRREISGEG